MVGFFIIYTIAMKELIKEHFKYIIIWFSVIIFAIIIGISFYYVETNKSESIERQKNLEFQQEQQKLEFQKQQYIAKRSKECWDIFYKQAEEWVRNIISRNYDKLIDKCVIWYKLSACEGSDWSCEKTIEY